LRSFCPWGYSWMIPFMLCFDWVPRTKRTTVILRILDVWGGLDVLLRFRTGIIEYGNVVMNGAWANASNGMCSICLTTALIDTRTGNQQLTPGVPGAYTGGSDAVYLATALGPFVLTLLPGVWALRRAARAARPFLVGLALPCALAPFLSLTGDAYEIGSILVTRLAPWRAASPLLRGDDVLRVAAGLAGGRASLWMGLAAASLVGVLWAFAIYGLGGGIATALGESVPSGEEPSPTPRSATVRSSTANCQ